MWEDAALRRKKQGAIPFPSKAEEGYFERKYDKNQGFVEENGSHKNIGLKSVLATTLVFLLTVAATGVGGYSAMENVYGASIFLIYSKQRKHVNGYWQKNMVTKRTRKNSSILSSLFKVSAPAPTQQHYIRCTEMPSIRRNTELRASFLTVRFISFYF